MIETNTHEFKGIVILKAGPVSVGQKGLMKGFLYCSGEYIDKGKPSTQILKFTILSWADSKSKMEYVMPGDEVKFFFNILGKYSDDKKDYLGFPVCYNELV